MKNLGELSVIVSCLAFAVLLAVCLRGCEMRENSYQACVATHQPIECAGAELIRKK